MAQQSLGYIGPLNGNGGTGTGNVTTSGLTINKLPVATSAVNIEDSTLTYQGPANGYQMPQQFTVGSSAVCDSTAIMQLISVSKGFLVPRLTKAQRDLIVSPANGLLIYQTDNSAGFRYYDINILDWVKIGNGSVTTSGMAIGAIPVAQSSNNIETSLLTVSASALKSLYASFATVSLGGVGPVSTIVVGVGAGIGATATVAGDKLTGNVTINTGLAPSDNALMATVTFASALPSVPRSISITAGDENAASLGVAGLFVIPYYAKKSTFSVNNFQIWSGNLRGADSPLPSSTLILFYQVIL